MMLCDTVAVTDGARFWCAAITARKAVGFLVTPANIEVILNTGSIGLYPLTCREHLPNIRQSPEQGEVEMIDEDWKSLRRLLIPMPRHMKEPQLIVKTTP